jgi:hypothetical protein
MWPDLAKEMPYVIVKLDRDDSILRKPRPQ